MVIKYNFNQPLPSPYEESMPQQLDVYAQFQWRQHKLNDLILQGLAFVDDDGNVSFTNGVPLPSVSDSDKSEKIVSEPKTVSRQKRTTALSKSVKQKQTSESNSDVELIKYVPVSVMNAVRRVFPVSASKADLISAIVYLFTNGDCEISDKAKALVALYEKDDQMTSVNERLARLENQNRRQIEMLQSIELCTCFNTFDRRYGSNAPRKGAKNTEFRESDNLEMLARLRVQAMDQLHADEKERGRQIYNSIKNLND